MDNITYTGSNTARLSMKSHYMVGWVVERERSRSNGTKPNLIKDFRGFPCHSTQPTFP
jgi:hypothetical protein